MPGEASNPLHFVRSSSLGRRTAIRIGAALLALVLSAGPVIANENAADSTNADQLWTGGGLGLDLTGTGVTVGVWEAGSGGDWEVRSTHEAFASFNPATGNWDGPSRVTFGDTPSINPDGSGVSSHATHVAGTIAGAHIPGNESTWGMAPAVSLISYSAGSAIDELEAAINVDISNHSYGSPRSPWDVTEWTVSDGAGGTVNLDYDTWSFDWDTTSKDPGYGAYNSTSRNLDLALNARPKLLSFWSAGNSRNDADDRYDDLQNDGKFVTRFSSNFIANNSILGEDLATVTTWSRRPTTRSTRTVLTRAGTTHSHRDRWRRTTSWSAPRRTF